MEKKVDIMLLELFDYVDDEFLSESAPPLVRRRRARLIPKVIAAVICLAVISSAAVFTSYFFGKADPILPPAETIDEILHTDDADTLESKENDLITETDTHTDFSNKNNSQSEDSADPTGEGNDTTHGVESPTGEHGNTTDGSDKPTEGSQSSTGEPDREPEYLNGLQIVESGLKFWGGSYEGYRVYDVSELDSNNPWSAEVHLDTLPVFRNLGANQFHHFGGAAIYLDEDDMLTILHTEADRIDREIKSIIRDMVYRFGEGKTLQGNDAVTRVVWGICDDLTIEVNSLGGIRYIYDGTFLLPFTDDNEKLLGMTAEHEQIDMSSFGDPLSYTDAEVRELIDMINRMYPGTLSLDVPTPSVFVRYSFFGERRVSLCSFYDKSANYTESIINFNFNRYDLHLSSGGGELTIFGMPAELSTYTEKLGDYPVIGADEAEILLLNGDYLTTVPSTELEDGRVSADDVHMCELIYHTSSLNEYFIPYYKFYVELPYSKSIAERKGWDTRLKKYGVFYVPAVEAQYISNYTPKISFEW